MRRLYREIPWDINCEVSITLDGEYLKDFSIPFFVVKNKYVVGLKSIYDDICSYDIARMISYLRKLNKNGDIKSLIRWSSIISWTK